MPTSVPLLGSGYALSGCHTPCHYPERRQRAAAPSGSRLACPLSLLTLGNIRGLFTSQQPPGTRDQCGSGHRLHRLLHTGLGTRSARCAHTADTHGLTPMYGHTAHTAHTAHTSHTSYSSHTAHTSYISLHPPSGPGGSGAHTVVETRLDRVHAGAAGSTGITYIESS